jgi:hypothetical protein
VAINGVWPFAAVVVRRGGEGAEGSHVREGAVQAQWRACTQSTAGEVAARVAGGAAGDGRRGHA